MKHEIDPIHTLTPTESAAAIRALRRCHDPRQAIERAAPRRGIPRLDRERIADGDGMRRKLPEPSRSQWAILRALADTGALTLKKGRFFAAETPARSFAFTPVVQLAPRGFARIVGDGATRVEPTALCHSVLAARAAASTPNAHSPNSQPFSKDIRA